MMMVVEVQLMAQFSGRDWARRRGVRGGSVRDLSCSQRQRFFYVSRVELGRR